MTNSGFSSCNLFLCLCGKSQGCLKFDHETLQRSLGQHVLARLWSHCANPHENMAQDVALFNYVTLNVCMSASVNKHPSGSFVSVSVNGFSLHPSFPSPPSSVSSFFSDMRPGSTCAWRGQASPPPPCSLQWLAQVFWSSFATLCSSFQPSLASEARAPLALWPFLGRSMSGEPWPTQTPQYPLQPCFLVLPEMCRLALLRS